MSSGFHLETILLVEHDQAVRSVVQDVLVKAGFEVLVACTGPESLQIEKNRDGAINLLLVDIRLPGTTGPDLGAAFQNLRPDIHVMLISGFPDGALLLLNYGWYFIVKEKIPGVLVERVNDVLHTPRRDQGVYQFLTKPCILGLFQ